MFWAGPIDSESMERVIREIEECRRGNAERVRIILSSLGGSLDVAIAFHDLIRYELQWSNLIEIVVVGEASSSALMALMAANHRVAHENGTFVFHELKRHYYADTDMSAADLREDANVMEVKFDRVVNILSAHMAHDAKRDTIRRWCQDRTILSGTRMFEAGLCTELRE